MRNRDQSSALHLLNVTTPTVIGTEGPTFAWTTSETEDPFFEAQQPKIILAGSTEAIQHEQNQGNISGKSSKDR